MTFIACPNISVIYQLFFETKQHSKIADISQLIASCMITLCLQLKASRTALSF